MQYAKTKIEEINDKLAWALGRVEELERELDYYRRGGWISTEERLPPANTGVFAYTDTDGILTNMFIDDTGEWISSYLKWSGHCVTHWMPMPLPPINNKEKEDEK